MIILLVIPVGIFLYWLLDREGLAGGHYDDF